MKYLFSSTLSLASQPAKGDQLHGVVPARIHILLLCFSDGRDWQAGSQLGFVEACATYKPRAHKAYMFDLFDGDNKSLTMYCLLVTKAARVMKRPARPESLPAAQAAEFPYLFLPFLPPKVCQNGRSRGTKSLKYRKTLHLND